MTITTQVPGQLARPIVGAIDILTVTPSDSVDFTKGICRALYVGTGGTVVALMASGTVATFTSVPAGSILPIQISRVNSTSTTASSMVALY